MATDEEEGEESDKKKGKKKKSKHVVITYDEDRDATTATKQHKRGDGWDIRRVKREDRWQGKHISAVSMFLKGPVSGAGRFSPNGN